jgi:demethylmenaquinone methyltransferase/2-methoxy-6-polyprenyl-1,4-benzoquinol methylase
VREYYDRRAPEYDDWYAGQGRFADRDRPGWHDELDRLTAVLAALPAATTLDVACGTGFLTRHLRGDIVALDSSEAMLAETARAAPHVTTVCGDALALPFPDASFDRVFTGHFFGHLEEADRDAFLREARRVARELVVIDSARTDDTPAAAWQERILNDGTSWQVYKRWFTPNELADEIRGGEILFGGDWFVAVSSHPQPRVP